MNSEHIEVFYDGECSLCVREIRFLKWMDRRRGRIRFTNIAATDFSAERFGKTQLDFMAQIHARTSDGRWLVGVEVFRRLYSAVGCGLLVWPTRLPGISHAIERAYDVFAKNRLRLTGRCDDRCGIGLRKQIVTQTVTERSHR